MNDILILASYGDVHAAAVEWALQRMGARPRLWYGCEFPERQVASIHIAGGRSAMTLREGEALLVDANRVRTVWHRRPQAPRVPAAVHQADAPVVEVESKRMMSALLHELERESFWVNPREQAMRANDKPQQLTAAAAAGLTVPETLFSNDPEAIREFFERHHGNVIYKSFLQPQWLRESRTFSYFTSVLPRQALENTFSLKSCPGIYQPRVAKAYEVRLTLMGDQAFTTKIDSQSDAKSAVDWRQDMLQRCPMSEVELPEAVLAGCRRLMRQLGLVFGCLDFIVTPDGEHVFLEVNEMGQFLWVEERVPSVPMLQSFARLLAEGTTDFEPDEVRREDLSFASFLASDAYTEFKRASENERPWQLQAVPDQ